MPRPLEGHYGVSVTIALLALSPYVVLTSASVFYQPQLMQELGSGRVSLELIAGLGTAGYAFGALLGGDLTNRFRQRSLFLLFEALFVCGSLIAASAHASLAYGSGRVLQGLATGVLLVNTLPPVIRGFPAQRMPRTAGFVNIGFFGAVTAGPLLGGIVAAEHAWRYFYGGLAGLGLVALSLAALALPDRPPPNQGLKFDLVAIGLGLAATVLSFGAVSILAGQSFSSVLFWLPLTLGLGALLALLLTEYHRDEPLSPVKMMWSTFPVTGTLAAMLGGGAYMTLVMLPIERQLLAHQLPPLQVGLAFWPQLIGVLISAILLTLLLRTRYLALLILGGLLGLIAAGIAVAVLGAQHPYSLPSLAAVGVLGLAAGATVSPGMYLAGLSLPAAILGRVFALVELVRSIANFLLYPVMLKLAQHLSRLAPIDSAGLEHAVFITVLIAAGTIAACLGIYLSGCRRLMRPDIQGWLEQQRVALDSPPLGAALRPPVPAGARAGAPTTQWERDHSNPRH